MPPHGALGEGEGEGEGEEAKPPHGAVGEGEGDDERGGGPGEGEGENPPNVPDPPDPPDPPANACLNAGDQFALEPPFDGIIDEIVRNCGVRCYAEGAPDVRACIVDCVLQAGAGLSEPCATCWAGKIICRANRCQGACAGGEGTPSCDNCLRDNCLADFTACSGLDSF